MDWYRPEDLRIEAYTSILCFGGSGAGKSFESVNILLNRDKVFNKEHEKTLIFLKYEQEIFKFAKEQDDSIILVDNKEDLLKELDDSSSSLVVIDDFLINATLEAENNKFITQLFLEYCHHRSTSLIFQSQLLFPKHGKQWTVNCSHMMLFRSYHESQVIAFLRNLGSEAQFLYKTWKECTESDYGYMFLSLHPKTKEYLRVRNSVVPKEGVKIFTNNKYDSAFSYQF